MDIVFKKMDFLVNHWQPFDRHFPTSFPVIAACYVEGKRNWVRTKFTTCNFSLILKGRGEYRRGGQIYEVQSPCVITQWPGEDLEYGPPIPEETWDELYLIYAAKLMPKFKRSGLIDLRRPIWPIANLVGVQIQIEELRRLANADEPDRVVDRVSSSFRSRHRPVECRRTGSGGRSGGPGGRTLDHGNALAGGGDSG